MGRRSINTTRSGRFMNPTDQVRKEARKKELKRNKKQRMAVRHAVLKSKEPLQLLEESTILDKQEYDPSVLSHLNERVIQLKRKRLLETFDRLMILYRKEDAEKFNRLQSARQDYDKRRNEMMLYYEQVKLAERVKASEIPLPKLPQSQLALIASDIPLPIGNYAKSILKKSGVPGLPPSILPLNKKPPGPPPGTPPDLSDSEGEESSLNLLSKQRKIRFAEPNTEFTNDNPNILSGIENILKLTTGISNLPLLSQIPLPPPTSLPSFIGMIRPGFPGAPQMNLSRFNFHRPMSAVLSAPPSLHVRDPLDNADLVGGPACGPKHNVGQHISETIIEAKPQLKNLIGDATRFVPTALKVRRTTRDPSGRIVTTGGGTTNANGRNGKQTSAVYDRIQRHDGIGAHSSSIRSKDVAYEEFMREMDGLL